MRAADSARVSFQGKILAYSDKDGLDRIIKEFKGQPVGDGYIDIIVLRQYYKPFAEVLINNGFLIEAISWWEYIDSVDTPHAYGMGGPRSKYYPGWFSEVSSELDELPPANDVLAAIFEIIENKALGEYGGKRITFKGTKSLTPAFWLKVDEKWKSRY